MSSVAPVVNLVTISELPQQIGQVVTLRVPAERLREVNRAIEKTAWGGYRTEFYPTYDYRPTAAKEREGLPSAFN